MSWSRATQWGRRGPQGMQAFLLGEGFPIYTHMMWLVHGCWHRLLADMQVWYWYRKDLKSVCKADIGVPRYHIFKFSRCFEILVWKMNANFSSESDSLVQLLEFRVQSPRPGRGVTRSPGCRGDTGAGGNRQPPGTSIIERSVSFSILSVHPKHPFYILFFHSATQTSLTSFWGYVN
jgi:hypothetical protein